MSISQTRYIESQILQDLKKKMVFIGGPRQVGKTTLAQTLLKRIGNESGYLNWDYSEDREKILLGQLPQSKLWVFDELHKYKKWRGLIKGLYDKLKEEQKFLVTGSARLDYYRYKGDSLQGRYHYLRLHPLSVAELKIKNQKELHSLLELGGFPEPFFSQKKIEAQRWSREYRTRLIRDDLSSIESVEDLGSLENLLIRLPSLVGSPLSLNSLREDLRVSHRAITRWVEILERVYAVFRLAPFGGPKIRAVRKEQKHYHWDWTLIKERGFRFENLIASHLLKWVHFIEDTEGREIELRYFKDTEKREVDFIITEDKIPLYAIECKLSDTQVSPSLKYFSEKYPKTKCFQLLCDSEKDFISAEGIRVCNAVHFLKNLV